MNWYNIVSAEAASDAPQFEFNNLGVKKLNRGDNPGALADFTTAIRLAPNFDLALANRAVVKLRLHDYPGAMADFNWALRVSPKCLSALAGRARLKDILGDYKGAIDDYTQLIANGQFNFCHQRGVDKQKIGDKLGSAKDFESEAALRKAYPTIVPPNQE